MTLLTALITAVSILALDQLKPSAQIIGTTFSRNRTITLEKLLQFFVFSHGTTISQKIKSCYFIFQKFVSRQAVFKRMNLLNFSVWDEIQKIYLEKVYFNLDLKKMNDCIVIAVDGTKIALPPHLALKQIFGGSLNQHSKDKESIKTPMMHLSVAYDPLNHQILDVVTKPHDVSEIVMLFEHLERLGPFLKGKKVLFLADRYYPSAEFFKYCEMNGFYYLIRAKSNFFKDQRIEIPEHIHDRWFERTMDKAWLRRLKHADIREYCSASPVLKIRLIRNDYTYLEEKKGERGKYKKEHTIHVEYFTNLPEAEWSRNKIIHAYHHDRWGVEKCYFVLKEQLDMETVNTQNPIGIINMVRGRCYLFNIEKLIYIEATKHLNTDEFLPNNQSIIETLRIQSIAEDLVNGTLKQEKVDEIVNEAARERVKVRPGRHVQRWGIFSLAVPRCKHRLDGRRNPIVKAVAGGYITSSH